ncbi:hypothetical protein LTR10_015200 [Elasticomyces elasticus]|uniref:Lysine-specific metallo-endopeptidase domain-containing protein n=1 Tax=Exophiala sideris TaxID=1016849 RepID=A0ABR0JE67_9EURO|nr:hypothetical protein LTR10_015200 [Elasticomyces elasticus]KAK5032674.1 hypothetical protein LTS07_004084 [Exophiala sideris]KAK5037145.1 hypothetical protein LTR13_004950 [Exophiala sideris]KAK5062199.1 hypothetical protein LTR69_004557 [Exophiala sideris]KAK5182303.1 hypothetical protein LTR44_005314 [Eurotiomycetes sp. CCFEE 6388]
MRKTMEHFSTIALRSLVIALLLIITPSQAALPQFIIAEGTTVQAPQQALQLAFKDAITLARIAGSLFDPCEAVYLRFFRAIDAVFVKQVFQTVANIPLDAQLDADTVIEILSSAAVADNLQPKFESLELALGNNPSLPSSKQDCGKQVDGGEVFAFSYVDPGALGPAALVSLCDQTFEFPTLQEIEDPPARYRDGEGNPLPGFTCDGLGDHDTDWMQTPGVVLLHELMHWTYLLEDIPNYEDLIDENEDGFPQIVDFAGPDPVDGYGPYNTMRLRQVKAAETIQNADSYVWYAQSKYWSWKCGKTFGPSVEPADDEKRLGIRAIQVQPESGI